MPGGDRLREGVGDRQIEHRRLVDHDGARLDRACARSRLNVADFGSKSSRRCSVVASPPVASLSRFAARPVGAASRTTTPACASIERMARTMVVLPTPGPPGHDEDLPARRLLDGAPLLGRELDARARFEVARWPRPHPQRAAGADVASVGEPLRESYLGARASPTANTARSPFAVRSRHVPSRTQASSAWPTACVHGLVVRVETKHSQRQRRDLGLCGPDVPRQGQVVDDLQDDPLASVAESRAERRSWRRCGRRS